MLQFEIEKEKCIRCGVCAGDCPPRIIEMGEGYPTITAEKEGACYKCQHCLAVCPTGALSILGRKPEESRLLAGNYPAPEQLETLIKGRRSVRRYRDENLDPALLQRLLEVAWHAPTGVNARQVLFTVVDDRERMTAFRKATYDALGEAVRAGRLPEERGYFADFLRAWEEKETDVLFRGAPHFLVASAPRHCPCPLPDCLIALSYFELYAQTQEVGTVWDGLARYVIDELAPSLRERLGIPAEHLFGYAMAFGPPAVSYQRTVQHAPAQIVRVK